MAPPSEPWLPTAPRCGRACVNRAPTTWPWGRRLPRDPGRGAGCGAARTLSVVLVESHDFARARPRAPPTGARRGALPGPGGNVGLVYEALHERSHLLAMPRTWRSRCPCHARLPLVGGPVLRRGLKMYDLLAGKAGWARPNFSARPKPASCCPPRRRRSYGGVKYWDGQFDDARSGPGPGAQPSRQGAAAQLLRAVDVLHTGTQVSGLRCRDSETGRPPRCGTLRGQRHRRVGGCAARERRRRPTPPPSRAMVAPSQGVPTWWSTATSSPATMPDGAQDGRWPRAVAVPWLGQRFWAPPTPRAPTWPRARAVCRRRGILNEAAATAPARPAGADVKFVWVGLRPLVQTTDDDGHGTKAISREHGAGQPQQTGHGDRRQVDHLPRHGRRRADQMRRGRFVGGLGAPNAHHRLVGAPAPGTPTVRLSEPPGEHLYGQEAATLHRLPGADRWIAPSLSEAMVRFAGALSTPARWKMCWPGATGCCSWMPRPLSGTVRWQRFCTTIQG